MSRLRRRLSFVKDHLHSRYFRSAGWLLGGAAAARVTALAATIAVSHILVPRQFGQLTLLQTTLTFLTGFATSGLAVAVTRQVAESRAQSPEKAGRYLSATVMLTAGMGILVTAVYLVARGPIADAVLQSKALENIIAASAGSIVFAALTGVALGGLMGLESFGSVAKIQWLQAFATSVGLVIGAVVANVTGALVGFSIGSVVAAVGASYLLVRDCSRAGIRIRSRPAMTEFRALWRFGGPAFIAFISVSAALLLSQLLLARQTHGYTEVAVFNAAYRWHLAILFIPAAIAPVLLPMMTRLRSQRRHADSRRLFRLNVGLTLALSAGPAVLVAAFATQVMSLNGDFYSHHATPLIALAIASVPSALNNVLSSASVSLGAIRAWLISDLVLALTFFGTAIVLISSDGADGLALAYLAGYISTDAVLVFPVWRRLTSLTEPASLWPPSDPEHT